MSYTLDAILAQALDNYPVTAILSPEAVAVLFYAISQIENTDKWLDLRDDPFDQITPTDKDQIEELIGDLSMSIISPLVGYIQPYITTNPPDNTVPCDGGTYNREDFPLLYAVIDAIFIVDADHFRTPDYTGAVLLGAGTVGLRSFALGDTGGEYEHQLSESELASHAHSIQRTVTTLVLEPGEVPGLTPIPILVDFTGNTGGDVPHNNIQPFGVVKYCVVGR